MRSSSCVFDLHVCGLARTHPCCSHWQSEEGPMLNSLILLWIVPQLSNSRDSRLA